MQTEKDYTLSFARANAYAAGLIIPIFAVYWVPYALFHGWKEAFEDLTVYFTNIPLFVVSIVAGTILHELIHAVCWSWLDKIPRHKIHFGFKWSTLTPYVHCDVPIRAGNYRTGVAMPGLVLGLLPFLLALGLQNGWLFGFGMFFTLAAGGDILVLWLLRDVDHDLPVQDHPELIGCRVFHSETNL